MMKAEIPVNSEMPTVAATAGSLPRTERTPVRAAFFFKLLTQCVVAGALAYSSYFLITHFVLQSVQVVGNSMAPTLENTGRYLLNRWVYLVREPQRADIVVLRDPADNGYSVKRIVAASGDAVCLKAGRVYVNGRLLDEPYLAPGTATYAQSAAREQSLVCAKDQYFVLGDNRNNSADSRIYGPVSRQKILGVVIH
jgi:signal peptidase I